MFHSVQTQTLQKIWSSYALYCLQVQQQRQPQRLQGKSNILHCLARSLCVSLFYSFHILYLSVYLNLYTVYVHNTILFCLNGNHRCVMHCELCNTAHAFMSDENTTLTNTKTVLSFPQSVILFVVDDINNDTDIHKMCK